MSKKHNIIAKFLVTFCIITLGFLSSISTPTSFAQSVGMPDLPFLDFNGNNNNKENDNLKELYDMIPGLNTRDNNDVDDSDSKTENKEEEMKVNESPNSENGKDKDKDKDKGTSSSMITPSSSLASILDKLPYSDVLSDYLTSSSSSSPSTSSESEMGEVIPGQYIVVLNDDTVNLREILTSVASQVNIEGTEILHIYEDVLNGFTINVPNERIIEVLEQSPFVDYIEKDKVVKTFAQTLPKGIDRVDGDLSYTRSGNGAGSVNADIA
ncbi:MAG TPA: protease inhibitor I9 family protein, partial [Nitrososphaeraceae archaeon]